ncbi:MAG: hypothetical protein H6624_06870 [Bdellovibrionaceae bacterium]|nr:hypothetical protein [Pseudobdellovibrionaceae bacterium]
MVDGVWIKQCGDTSNVADRAKIDNAYCSLNNVNFWNVNFHGELVALADVRVEFMGNYDFPRGTKLTFKKGVLVKAEADPKSVREIRLYYLLISQGYPVLFSELYGTPTEFTVADQSMLYGHVVEGELKVYWSPNYLEGAQKIEVLKDGSWGGRHLFPNLKKGQVIVFEGGVPKLK